MNFKLMTKTCFEAWQVFGAETPNRRSDDMDYMTEAHRLVQRHKAEKQKMNDEEKLKVIRHFRSPVDGND